MAEGNCYCVKDGKRTKIKNPKYQSNGSANSGNSIFSVLTFISGMLFALVFELMISPMEYIVELTGSIIIAVVILIIIIAFLIYLAWWVNRRAKMVG